MNDELEPIDEELPLTQEGALLDALTAILNNDQKLRERGNGAFFGRADIETATPFLTFRITGSMRETTFGGEAYRLISFFVKATWDDRAGTNYEHGDKLMVRVNWLLDGGAKAKDGDSSAKRVQARWNTLLSPLGFYLMRCALQTPLPPAEEFLGESLTGRFNMGSLFHALLRETEALPPLPQGTN